MLKTRFYHIKTLLWTYLVWVALNAFIAFGLREFTTSSTLISIPYYWAMLHILPLYGLIRTLWEGDIDGFTLFLPGVIAGLSVIAGLLIKGRWARFLIIIGISIWFLVAFCVLGLGA